jgi:hypothetical protein
MSINKTSSGVGSNLYDTYVQQKNKERLEVKESLAKIEEDMCKLKSILAQIDLIKNKKNVP